jgi:hypothetical protein
MANINPGDVTELAIPGGKVSLTLTIEMYQNW